ncbi:MAG: hypothetical protein KatS3mg111_0222 [Pirellulaceae bacterium]|nr:MAG: hypothetical protein KatS3mg111_0222 [Pirellulaceae bacterium]
MHFSFPAFVRFGLGGTSGLLVLLWWGVAARSSANAQEVPVATSSSGSSTGVRKLAPDVLEVIPPSAQWGDTALGPVNLPLVAEHPELQWTPNYFPVSDTLIRKASQVTFRTDVYCLEFAFKPVRMIEVEVPTAEGLENKTVWYLLYRVRYLGGDLHPVPEPDKYENEVFGNPQAVSSEWVRFLPTFHLDTLGLGLKYLDQVIPVAKAAIERKERVGLPVHDTLQIQTVRIERSTPEDDHPVWGVAMWTDVDPRVDFFSVVVGGLTNAQQIEQTEEGGLRYPQKRLVLNFWRPGDTIDEVEDRIRFGVPAISDAARQRYVLAKYGLSERLDYYWDYR